MLAEVFFWGIVIYLIYKIVFGFIVPVSHAGKQMRQQFQNMHEHMHQQTENFQQSNQQQNSTQEKSKNVAGDYIDFEEVKK